VQLLSLLSQQHCQWHCLQGWLCWQQAVQCCVGVAPQRSQWASASCLCTSTPAERRVSNKFARVLNEVVGHICTTSVRSVLGTGQQRLCRELGLVCDHAYGTCIPI
jgi:hypothetical protein